MPDRLLNVTEMAKYLGVSESTVLRLVRAGSVPVVRVRRRLMFHRGAVQAALTEPAVRELA